MITINEIHYKNLARILFLAINENDFFNGTLEYDTEEFYSSLRITLIISRDAEKQDNISTHKIHRIKDIIPVWWEYHTYAENAEELNTFSWNEFKEYLL